MKRFVAITLCMTTLLSCLANFKTYDYRCECLTSPIGIDTPIPGFSWKIKSSKRMVCQKAYEIEVASSEYLLENGKADLWKSGYTESPQQIMVRYCGQPLHSKDICYWRVRIYGEKDEVSKWSEPQRFTIGILDNDTMSGKYIGAYPGQGKSSLLRRKFRIDNGIDEAFLYINSLGYHEVYINGNRVSDAVLQPAVSQLNKRSLIVTYEVGKFLNKGTNDIVIWTSSGWYKPLTFNASYGGALVKAELDADGRTLLCTDGSWMGSYSGYRDYGTWRPNQFGGEVIDASLVPESFSSDDLDQREWKSVDVVDVKIKASQQMCEPCRIQETISPVCIVQESDSSFLVDFGKIINGQVEISLPYLSKGTKVPVIYQDWRNPDGTFQAFGNDTLISSGKEGGDTFKEKFNHQVFRYVLIKNIAESPLNVKAFRMRTDYSRRATFECSDNDINNIEKMITYTMENLAFDGYMVDCASVERLGYGGDGNASALSFQTVFDVAPLYRNWMMAWRDAIREDGGLPHTAPNPYAAGGGPYWCSFIVQAPWRAFMSYADDRVLKECYPTMKKWLEYVDTWTKDGLLSKWPDEEYRGWYLGDWLAPRGTNYRAEESINLINNCALMQCYEQLVKISALLGENEDKEDFLKRKTALALRINQVFYHEVDSTYGTGTQLDMVYPMLTGVVSKDEYNKVETKLFESIEHRDSCHMAVGLVGVPVFTEWITTSRNYQLMYTLLKKRDYPGYLYMLDNGATATWEDWDKNSRSHLHNCFNGVGSWFYQALGGIIPTEPAYSKVVINPQIPEGIEWVSVKEETPYGPLSVYATKSSIKVTIPVGVTAKIAGKEYPNGTYVIRK